VGEEGGVCSPQLSACGVAASDTRVEGGCTLTHALLSAAIAGCCRWLPPPAAAARRVPGCMV
jgi:hypothetical protein